ncbi:MAG: hypothetical protein OXD50_03320 [Chloroflexi bacterium]|nr:hypothetical protein [Chloroflexota bacterium]
MGWSREVATEPFDGSWFLYERSKGIEVLFEVAVTLTDPDAYPQIFGRDHDCPHGDSSRTLNCAGGSGADTWQFASEFRKADAAYNGNSITRASSDGAYDYVQTINGGSVDSDFDEIPADPRQTVYGGVAGGRAERYLRAWQRRLQRSG